MPVIRHEPAQSRFATDVDGGTAELEYRLTPDRIAFVHTFVPKAARGQGVGQMILTHLLDRARGDGMSRVSLETGTIDLFAPARALYLRNGFEECPPFGDYTARDASVFMRLAL